MRGDWITCLHVLIPQIENSIRHVMEESGLIVTHLGDDLVQMEFDLNSLLRRPEINQILGEDLVYALRVLLIEQAGKNLRNKMAHGLLSAAYFKPDPVNFLWATTILLCQIGKALVSHAEKGDDSEHSQPAGQEPTDGSQQTASPAELEASSELGGPLHT